MSAFVISRLDYYCNSLLSGCPKHFLEKSKKVQNSAVRLVFKAHKRDHVSPLLRTLHWLPIQARVEYKLSTLCHPFFSATSPVWLSDLMSTLHQDSSAPPLTQEPDAFRTLRPTHLDIAPFPMRFLLSGILCLVKLDIQSTSAFKNACLNAASASEIYSLHLFL